MNANSTVTSPSTRRSVVSFSTVAVAAGVCTSCTPAVVNRYCVLSSSVRLVLLVSATDDQRLLERETPNPTLSAAITRIRSDSHLGRAVSRDASESHELVEVAASCFLTLRQHRIQFSGRSLSSAGQIPSRSAPRCAISLTRVRHPQRRCSGRPTRPVP